MTCFRCDWVGEAPSGSCPRCRAPLHPPEPREPARRGPGRFLALAVAAVVVIGVAYRELGPTAAERPRRGAEPGAGSRAYAALPPPFPGLAGRLVFASLEPAGATIAGQRLWVFDLGTGRLTQGPRVPGVQEFLAGSAPGGLVFTTVAAGEGSAYSVPAFEPGARPSLLARGDLFATSPDGRVLFVGRSEPGPSAEPGCSGHAVSVERVAVATGARRVMYRAELPCGDLLSLGADDAGVFVSLVERGRSGVYELRASGPRLVLADHALLSVSPVGGMLVTPAAEGPVRGLGVWPGTPTGPARYWGGAGEPVRFLSDRRELFIQRIVAWDLDGSEAVVTGILESRRGMWRVRTTVADRRSSTRLSPVALRDEARRIRPALPDTEIPANIGFSGGTFSVLLGPVFTSMPGRLFVLVDEGPAAIPLPPAAAAPAGPLTWVP